MYNPATMLVQFKFENFRSFKDEAILNLVAASKLQSDPLLDSGNVFLARERPKLELLRVGALYGANASGKSNVTAALSVFKRFVRESANIDFRIDPEPFLLDITSRDAPTSFEITFLMTASQELASEPIQYRYGFEIKRTKDKLEVLSEWLFEAETTTEALLFEREGSLVRHGRRFTEGKPLLMDKHINRTGSLFLSVAAQLGTPKASSLVWHLINGISVLSGLNDDGIHSFTKFCLANDRYSDLIQDLVREADTGIPGIFLTEEDGMEDKAMPTRVREGSPYYKGKNSLDNTFVMANHPVFDLHETQVDTAHFPFLEKESQGTQKLFDFAGPIFDTLARGAVLVIDEMDARFHPMLTRALVRLFQSSESNPNNAQLIFVTHDTNLLDSKSLRRDQIMFVEKDRLGGSHMYALSDFKGIRKGSSFEQEYLEGRYGAIPFLGGLSRLFTDSSGVDHSIEIDSENVHADA